MCLKNNFYLLTPCLDEFKGFSLLLHLDHVLITESLINLPLFTLFISVAVRAQGSGNSAIDPVSFKHIS